MAAHPKYAPSTTLSAALVRVPIAYLAELMQAMCEEETRGNCRGASFETLSNR
jgi:hypothetical protein